MIDIIIPVYHPDMSFREVLNRLLRQTILPRRIILMNTGEEFWNPALIEGISRVEVHHVTKQEFDHAGTRRKAAELSDAEYMMFMTQDALPADSRLVEALLKALENPSAAGAFARQLPRKDCNILERCTRSFNYPEQSYVREREDIQRLGIRAYFFSDVCSMYRKSDYNSLGGFVERAIFNEDMFFAAKALNSGKTIVYAAEAKVYHSHNFSNMQYLRRNFDMGVSQAEHKEIFEGISSEKEGIKLIRDTCTYLIHAGKGYAILQLVVNSGFKWIGYRLGKSYAILPEKLIRKLTSNPSYWE